MLFTNYAHNFEIEMGIPKKEFRQIQKYIGLTVVTEIISKLSIKTYTTLLLKI